MSKKPLAKCAHIIYNKTQKGYMENKRKEDLLDFTGFIS